MHFQKNALWLNYFPEFSWKEKKKFEGLGLDSLWGLRTFSLSHARGKTKKSYTISLPSSKLPISISSYKYDAIDIADPSSMQGACHMNFVIDLAHRWVFVTQW